MQLAELLDTLRLNRYEKDAILYLAKVETATATEIKHNSTIPQGRIYSVLQELIHKNVVEVIPLTPKKYKIPDVKKALQLFLNSEQSLLEEKMQCITMIDNVPKEFNLKVNDPSINLFKGRQEHLSAIIAFKDSASKEIQQIAPIFNGSFASRRSAKKALEKGVKIRIIIGNVTPQNRQNIKEYQEGGAIIKYLITSDLLSLVIKDDKEFLLGIQDYHNQEERLTMFSRNKAVLSVLQKTFDECWKKAVLVKLQK